MSAPTTPVSTIDAPALMGVGCSAWLGDTDKSGALSFQEAGVALKKMMEERFRNAEGRRE